MPTGAHRASLSSQEEDTHHHHPIDKDIIIRQSRLKLMSQKKAKHEKRTLLRHYTTNSFKAVFNFAISSSPSSFNLLLAKSCSSPLLSFAQKSIAFTQDLRESLSPCLKNASLMRLRATLKFYKSVENSHQEL